MPFQLLQLLFMQGVETVTQVAQAAQSQPLPPASGWQSVISVIAPVTSVGSIIAIYKFFKSERRESDKSAIEVQETFFTRLDQRDRAFLETLKTINDSISNNKIAISSLENEIDQLRQQQERTSLFLLTIARTGTQPWTEESISRTLKMIREEKI